MSLQHSDQERKQSLSQKWFPHYSQHLSWLVRLLIQFLGWKYTHPRKAASSIVVAELKSASG